MNIHDILLAIQYITIGVLFIEILIVFLKWKNPIHSYLLLACISSFISNLGYLFEMQAVSEETYLAAFKFSYAGRIWIAFAFFLFAARMCRRKLPRVLIPALVLVHVFVYISVLTVGKNSLYQRGIIQDLFAGLNAVYIVFSIVWVVIAFCREKNRISRQRYFMLILAFGVQALSSILQYAHVFAASESYDLTMPGTLLGTVFLLIGIFRFDLMGTREIARDFVIDRISEGIIVVDNDGRIQYYNEPAAKLYPAFDSFYALKPNGKSTQTPYDVVSMIRDAVRTDKTLTVDGRIYTPEENELLFRGESYGKLYALVDDTEHYQYMEELQKQRDIADSANEAKSRFLASMSHEIRTPINAVLGMDEMILRESSEKGIRSYATDIKSAGRTLLSLINDILDLSKVEEGKMEIIPVQYDLSSLINDLINMTRDRAAKKGLQFHVTVEESIPHLLLGDEIRIRQCVMNLLTNAVKYTEAGEVSLGVSHEKKDAEHILLRINVKDTGIGMKEEDMENLFSPYKRIEEKRNRTIEGTGLGMSITRQLLHLMGSTLQVKSEYGKGSEFSFAIDQEVVRWDEIGDIADRFQDMSAAAREYHELFHAPQARILVVDDTEMNLTVIQSLLKKTGIRIDTALSGKDALALAGDTLYDVIFIDHMMPDMDGIETLRRLRAAGMSKDAPAVALTANAISGAREMYLNAGFDDCLFKPVDGERLEKMLADMLPPEKLLNPADEDDGGESGSKQEGDASLLLLKNLETVDGIDENAGIANCGSAEGYLSVLSVFHRTAAAKADEIETFYQNEDTENYTVKVHALKSSSRIIGAAALSKLAAELEDAGKRKDTGHIRRLTDRLLAMYRELDTGLSFLDRADESLPEIEEPALREAYQTALEIAQSMDYGMMEDLLKYLREYRLPAPDEERVAALEKKLTELNWDGIIQIVEEAGR
ncbi:MAG: response regulator [Lachnospiraceae bacterium]|nr:response regulator [Lachnospiraceae bacterium]